MTNVDMRKIVEPYFQIEEILKLLNLVIANCVIWEDTELEDEYVDEDELFEILSEPGRGYTIRITSRDLDKVSSVDYVTIFIQHNELIPFIVEYTRKYASDEVKESVFRRLQLLGVEIVFLSATKA